MQQWTAVGAPLGRCYPTAFALLQNTRFELTAELKLKQFSAGADNGLLDTAAASVLVLTTRDAVGAPLGATLPPLPHSYITHVLS